MYSSFNEHNTITDVLPDDLDVIVTVTAGLFMVEAKSVEQLMLHSAVVKAAITGQRHSLCITLTTNVRVASVRQRSINCKFFDLRLPNLLFITNYILMAIHFEFCIVFALSLPYLETISVVFF